ncbi:MAG: hypothetical protein ABFD97_12865 [Syntrophobacter sp.]
MMMAARMDHPPIDPSVEMRVWLARRRIRPTDIAKELGVSPSAITHYIDGCFASKRIRDHFLCIGCPKEILPPERTESSK